MSLEFYKEIQIKKSLLEKSLLPFDKLSLMYIELLDYVDSHVDKIQSEIIKNQVIIEKLFILNDFSILYFNHNKFKESLGIDEMIFSLDGEDLTLVNRMIISYEKLGLTNKSTILKSYLNKKIENKDYDNDYNSTAHSINETKHSIEDKEDHKKQNSDSNLFSYISYGLITISVISLFLIITKSK